MHSACGRRLHINIDLSAQVKSNRYLSNKLLRRSVIDDNGRAMASETRYMSSDVDPRPLGAPLHLNFSGRTAPNRLCDSNKFDEQSLADDLQSQSRYDLAYLLLGAKEPVCPRNTLQGLDQLVQEMGRRSTGDHSHWEYHAGTRSARSSRQPDRAPEGGTYRRAVSGLQRTCHSSEDAGIPDSCPKQSSRKADT